MSSYLTVFKENTQVLKDLSVIKNTLSSYDIMTTSGNINLTTDNTFLNTYDSYSLDGSQLPLFNLGKPVQETNVIQKKNLSLYNNKRNGNVKIKLNLSGSYGVTNLTFINPKTELLFIDNQWNVLNGPPLYVDTQQGTKLVGSGSVGSSIQGISISLSADGNTLAIGGQIDNSNIGATWIFTRSGTTWIQQGSKLVGTGSTGSSRQGSSVSLSADGNTLAIGGLSDNSDIGATWIFIRSGTSWTQQGSKLVGSGASDPARQGSSVSLSANGNTLAIGGPLDGGGDIGATWIFTRSGTTWTQQGSKLVGTASGTIFSQGKSVSLSADGNTLAIGATNNTFIFTRIETTWTQQGSNLVGSGGIGPTNQGISVSLSANGNTLAIGGESDNTLVGASWIFTRSGTNWNQQGSKIVGSGVSGTASQGYSVSLSADGNTLAIGGYSDNSNQGATWIFTRENTIWTQQGNKLVGTGNSGAARSGRSVFLSSNGSTLAVGGYADNSNVGATWIFN